MENQSFQNFQEVCAPKAEATKNLDELSRVLCPMLDVFVCFSSVSCGKGNAGQTNYGYANSVMERVCETRHKDGLHGLAIQWGIIGDVGLVHRNMGEDAMIRGAGPQRVKSCMATLEQFLQQDQPVVCSYVKFGALPKKADKQEDILVQLAKIFGVPDVSGLKTDRTFQEMGMDSMINTELQQLLDRNYDIILTTKEMQCMTVDDLCTLTASKGAKKSKSQELKQPQENSQVEFLFPKSFTRTKSIISLNAKTAGTPVYIVHHAEPELLKLNSFAGKINCPVYGLICIKKVGSIEDIVMSHLKEIRDRHAGNPIHLVGYSSSACLAFEMAYQAQNSAKNLPVIQTLTFLDASLYLANTLECSWNAIPESERESSDLYAFVMQFTKSALPTLKEELEAKTDFQSRVGHAINLLSQTLPDDKMQIYNALELYMTAQWHMRDYKPKGKLTKDISVIEARAKLLPNDVILVKSAISKICNGQVSIQRIFGDENFLVEDDSSEKVAELLNNKIFAMH